MTRWSAVVMTAAVLAPSLLSLPAAHAGDEGLTFVPPFARDVAIGSAFYDRCPDGRGGPITVPRPASDATAVDYGEGVAARRCRVDASYSDRWTVGEIPKDWHGRRVRLEVDLAVRQSVIRDGGTRGRRGASLSMSLPGRSWTLLRTACRRDACRRTGLLRGRSGEVVRLWSEATLVETLPLSLSASATIDGTGRALVAMWARIDRIVVRPV